MKNLTEFVMFFASVKDVFGFPWPPPGLLGIFPTKVD